MSETTQETRTPELWTCTEDEEHLTTDSIEDAIAEWADGFDGSGGPLPETVQVYGFARMEVDEHQVRRRAEYALEGLLETLDEEYGNWSDGGEDTKPTEGMKAASEAFVRAVLAEYTVYACEQVTSEVVRVADYYTEADRV